jgi:hypothetical protein
MPRLKRGASRARQIFATNRETLAGLSPQTAKQKSVAAKSA